MDADGLCQLVADDHIPVYVVCESQRMEFVHGARELLEALINVMESHYDAHSWEKVKEIVNVMLDSVKGSLDNEEKACAGDAATKWRQWVQAAGLGGASQAHRWSRLPVQWRPHQVKVRGSGWSGSPWAILKDEAARKKAVLESTEVDHEARRVCKQAPLERPSVDCLRRASKSFRAGTARSYDAIHMRQFSLLPDEALEAWSLMMVLIEMAGTWPDAMLGMLMPLLEKAKGGYRGIGICPAVYRWWARARRDLIRQWERDHKSMYIAAASGSSCIDTIWRHTLLAEFNRCEGNHIVVYGWDMKEFYEHINRDKLGERAVRLDFPMAVIRAACAMYAAERLIQLGTMTISAGCPVKGIVAGCGHATYEVQVYVNEPLEGYMKAVEHTRLSLYIDDFTCTVMHTDKNRLVEIAAGGARRLQEYIEGELDCIVSIPKSQIVASSNDVLRDVRRKMGPISGQHGMVIEALGVDMAAGRSRRSFWKGSVRARRMRTMKKRRGRLARLRGACVGTARKVALVGVLPATAYGAEIYGAADKELWDIQSLCLSTMVPVVSGRDRRLALVLGDDPTWRLTAGPIIQYCKEVWRQVTIGHDPGRGFISMSDLSRAWARCFEDPPRKWAGVKGPIGAMWLSIKRLGWVWKGPFELVTDEGVVLSMVRNSPAGIGQEVKAAHFRAHLAAVVVRAGLPREKGICLNPIWDALRKKDIGVNVMNLIKVVCCGGVWTNSRLREAGYDVSGLCECGKGADTMGHRWFECERTAELRKDIDPVLLIWAKMLPVDHPYLRGLMSSPASDWPKPARDGCMEFWCADPRKNMFEVFEGEVFLDGSCTKPYDRRASRAGWAIIKMDNDYQIYAKLSGPVPVGWRQTSPVAEHAAMNALSKVAAGDVYPVVDYNGIVMAYGGKFSLQRLHAGNPLAGIVRTVCTNDQWSKIKSVDKVKAHQSLPDLIHGSDEYRWAVGNSHVDGVAKESIYQHPMGNACDMNAAKELGNKISEFLVFSAMAMEKWPRRPKAQKIKIQQAGDGDASRPLVNPLYPSHHWQWRPGSNRWVCISCLSDSATPSNRLDKCPGKSGRMILAMNGDLGHCLHAFPFDDGTAGFIIACSACGCWGEREPRGILLPCKKFMTKAAREAWQMLGRRKHPKNKGVLLASPVHVWAALNSQALPGVGEAGGDRPRSAGLGAGVLGSVESQRRAGSGRAVVRSGLGLGAGGVG